MASKDNSSALPTLSNRRQPTVADQIYQLIYERVVDLTLPPGARLSEAEVAAQMGVSRQPVRDAFWRLSEQGFLLIRPQRATLVTPISPDSVTQASFIRSALEQQVVRKAAEGLPDDVLRELDALIDQQGKAMAEGSLAEFHALDDQFHHDICQAAGLGFVWALVRENKGHMDRARFLSLSSGAPRALEGHRRILAAIRDRNPDQAAAAMHDHLDRIRFILSDLHEHRPEMFQAD